MPSFEQLPPVLQEGLADRAAHGVEVLIAIQSWWFIGFPLPIPFPLADPGCLADNWSQQLKPWALICPSDPSQPPPFLVDVDSSTTTGSQQCCHFSLSSLSEVLWNACDYLCSTSECISFVSATDTNFSILLCGFPDSALLLHVWSWENPPQLAFPCLSTFLHTCNKCWVKGGTGSKEKGTDFNFKRPQYSCCYAQRSKGLARPLGRAFLLGSEFTVQPDFHSKQSGELNLGTKA